MYWRGLSLQVVFLLVVAGVVPSRGAAVPTPADAARGSLHLVDPREEASSPSTFSTSIVTASITSTNPKPPTSIVTASITSTSLRPSPSVSTPSASQTVVKGNTTTTVIAVTMNDPQVRNSSSTPYISTMEVGYISDGKGTTSLAVTGFIRGNLGYVGQIMIHKLGAVNGKGCDDSSVGGIFQDNVNNTTNLVPAGSLGYNVTSGTFSLPLNISTPGEVVGGSVVVTFVLSNVTSTENGTNSTNQTSMNNNNGPYCGTIAYTSSAFLNEDW